MTTETKTIFKWTDKIKEDICIRMLARPEGQKVMDTFKVIQEFYPELSLGKIRWGYYHTMNNKPEVFAEAVKKANEIKEARGDLVSLPSPEKDIEVVAIVEDEKTEEDKLLESASRVIGGLSKMEDLNASVFLDGLAIVLEKATGAVERKEVEALQLKVDDLESQNNDMVEVMQYVSTIIAWFAGLSTQEKILNINKITNDLQNTIFNCIKN